MPALFVFLLKVNVALVLFCLGYFMVLRHLTFYTLNRIYLVIAILFSTLYPQINLSDFAQRHQQLTQPVETVILNWQAPAEKLVKPLARPDYWLWIEGIFWLGVALLTIRLAAQLFSLYKLYHKSKPATVQDYPVRLIGDNIGPFSFWRSIYINPANLSPADLKSVLEHEQVHVNEWHTVDILLAELSTIFYWFNPGVWLMKKAVRENIEFITDRKILKKGMDSKQYQYSLVSISLATTSNNIVNHFNISTIKKRIIMMNTKKSSGYKLTRYVFLPAVIGLLLVFSLSKAAITKTGLRTIKVLDSAISINPIVNNTNNTPSFIPAKKVNKTNVKHPLKTADTIYSGKSKDGNKSFMVTSNTKADSVNYVINGVRSTRADVKALDPGRIESIEMMEGKDARKFMPELDGNKHALFVTTEDSEKGKALKAKIDKEMGYGKLTNVSISRDGSSTVAPVAVGSGVSVSPNSSSSITSDDNAPVAIAGSGSNNVATSVVVVDNPRIGTSVSTRTSKSRVYTTNVAKGTIVLSNIRPDSVWATGLDSGASGKGLKRVYITGRPAANALTLRTEPSITMSDKLIIIDGKEATNKDMKNLKASDIKSISERFDDKTKEKYGDKAKHGVLYITTNKS